MEPIAESQAISQELQQEETTNPNASLWEQFYQKFSPGEKKMFLRNQSYLFAQLIAKDLRKRRESLRKLRENER